MFPDTFFVVYRGTDTKEFGDIAGDIGFIPFPIYPDPKEGEKAELLCHSGMYAYLMYDFASIWKDIESAYKKNKFSKMVITGNSLGGGLSILFGLISLISKKFNFIQGNFKIITFGAPSVIAFSGKALEHSENIARRKFRGE